MSKIKIKARKVSAKIRGISLLSVVRKVYVKILIDCVRLFNGIICEKQNGLVTKRDCIGKILVLRQVKWEAKGVYSTFGFRESIQ